MRVVTQLTKEEIAALVGPCVGFSGQATAFGFQDCQIIVIAKNRGVLHLLSDALNAGQPLNTSAIYPVVMLHDQSVIRKDNEL